MNQQETACFLEALNELGEIFCDELSELRLRLYLRTFEDRVTLEEWQYTCQQAIDRETFHKVPLPAKLWEYIQEYRAQLKRQQQALRAKESEERWTAVEAKLKMEQRLLEASPQWQEEQQRIQEKAAQEQREYQAWLQAQPRHVLAALGKINPPNPTRWHPLSEEELTYVPTVDGEARKKALRAQLEQLQREQTGENADGDNVL